MSRTYRLRFPVGARVLWLAVGLVTLPVAVGSGWVAMFGGDLSLTARSVAFGLGLGYAWIGDRAFRLGISDGNLEIGDDGIIVSHPALIGEAIRVELADVEGVSVDIRSPADRGVAVATRSSRASFVDQRRPVVSPSPRHHGRHPGAAPNVVVDFAGAVEAPRVPRAVRVLMAVSGGRSGAYRGPKRRKDMSSLRVEVADVDLLAADVAARGLERVSAGDEGYLEPITDADRARQRRQRLVVAGIVVAVLAVALLFNVG